MPSSPASAAPVACVAGRTYWRWLMRSFGRMKRMACAISPRATSSAVKSSGAIGRPAASA